MRQSFRVQFLIIGALLLSGCGVNNLPTLDEGVKAAWSQVQNQYQRRADLIPNLVATVKGYAAQERETLLAVTEARAKVGSMQVDPSLIDDPSTALRGITRSYAPTPVSFGMAGCIPSSPFEKIITKQPLRPPISRPRWPFNERIYRSGPCFRAESAGLSG